MPSVVSKLASVSGSLAFGALALFAYKDGPPPNRAGGFGGETCQTCHTGNPLNAPGGSLKIAGIPEAYRPSTSYKITITLAREGLYSAGFQIAARNSAREPVGMWQSLDDRAKIVEGFAEQTARGARASSDGENRWEIEWIAPASSAGEIVFNAAANASNDDASALGDFIYSGEVRVSPIP